MKKIDLLDFRMLFRHHPTLVRIGTVEWSNQNGR